MNKTIIINIVDDDAIVKKQKVCYTQLKQRVRKNLVKLRKKEDWTLDEASNKIGIKKVRLELMERGYEIKSLYFLQKIARGYDIDIRDLFS